MSDIDAMSNVIGTIVPGEGEDPRSAEVGGERHLLRAVVTGHLEDVRPRCSISRIARRTSRPLSSLGSSPPTMMPPP